MQYRMGHAVLRPELAVQIVTETPKPKTSGVPLMSLHYDAKRDGYFLVSLNPEKVVFILAERLTEKATELGSTSTQSNPAEPTSKDNT